MNMKHYLTNLEETIREQWTQKALCDYNGDSFTYAQLATNIERFKIFFETAGIGKGEKIAICARNSARWAMTFWGINVNERVVVPLLADFHPSNVSTLTNHSDSVVLFVDDDIWAKMNPDDTPNLKAAINVKNGSLLWHSDQVVADAWENRKNAFAQQYPNGMWPEQVSYPSDNGEELAIINYTSGTTGNPKGVMLTYNAMTDTDNFANTHFPNHPGQTVVSMLPLAHMYGLAIEFIHPNVDGVTVYFLGKTPSPTTLLKAMQDIKPYMVVTVPLVMEKIYANAIKPALVKTQTLLRIPGLNKLIYRKVRSKVIEAFGGAVQCFIMGGAALNPEAEQCFKKIHLPYTVGYGMTEATPLLAYASCATYVAGSCGRPVDCCTVRIDSEDPEHIAGEIQAKGENICIGYYKNPEASANAFTEDGFLKTGYLGIMDKDGNIFIKGRSKSMILTANGQNIYPEEVEAIINDQPFVAESVVVDRASHIVALVYFDQDAMKKAGLDAETIADLPERVRVNSNKKLANYSQISKVEVQEMPFEKTPKMSIKRFLYK